MVGTHAIRIAAIVLSVASLISFSQATADPLRSHPSFNCSAARMPDETLICSDLVLGERDRELADVFGRYRDRIDRTQKDALIREQREWITSRGSACGLTRLADINRTNRNGFIDCIQRRYLARIDALSSRLIALTSSPVSVPAPVAPAPVTVVVPPNQAVASDEPGAPVAEEHQDSAPSPSPVGTAPPIAPTVPDDELDTMRPPSLMANVASPPQTSNSGSEKVTAPAPPNGPASVPQDEVEVINAATRAVQEFETGQNDMQKGAARPARARAICAALPSHLARNWIGVVSKLDTNGDGKGVLSIQIAPNVYVMTWNNDLSDVFDQTLIDPGSALFRTVSQLKEGQKVRFSGSFPASETDCIKESSLTLSGSISEPEFIVRFDAVEPAE